MKHENSFPSLYRLPSLGVRRTSQADFERSRNVFRNQISPQIFLQPRSSESQAHLGDSAPRHLYRVSDSQPGVCNESTYQKDADRHTKEEGALPRNRLAQVDHVQVRGKSP